MIRVVKHKNGSVRTISIRKNNKLHNNYGPAIISYDTNQKVVSQHYFLDGKQVSKHEFLKHYHSI